MDAIICTLRVMVDMHNLKYTRNSVVAMVQMAEGYAFLWN